MAKYVYPWSKHPWDKWFKRKRVVLVKGEDFDCELHGMAQQIRNNAKFRDIEVSVKTLDKDTLEVTVGQKS